MKSAILLVPLVLGIIGGLGLGGCESEVNPNPVLKKEIAQLEAERNALRWSADRAANAFESLKRDRDNCRKQANGLALEVEQLRYRVDALTQTASESQAKNAQAKERARELEASLAEATRPAKEASSSTAPTPVPQPRATETATEAEAQLALVRSEIGKINTLVSTMVRSTLDVRLVPPANGLIIPPGGSWCDAAREHRFSGGPDGLILGRVLDGYTSRFHGGRIKSVPRYKYVPAGPAIRRGGFRTLADKNEAIAATKEPLAKLHGKRRQLEAKLKQLRGTLQSTSCK